MRTIIWLGGVAIALAAGVAAAEPARFETPDAAVSALVAALEDEDRAAVLRIFGPENEDVVSTGDDAEDRETWGAFLRDARAVRRLERDGDERAILYVGRESWQFPAPLVQDAGRWRFDAEAAREEVLARRIGGNELEVIEIMRRAGAVQAAYRRIDHDGDGVMEFAASILSSPGARNGLYWPDEPGAAPSPFGETIARASSGGFALDGTDLDPEPYEGYFFRILQGQGSAAPGGAYGYMIAGNMVAGHALLAYPAIYGDTGIMSFLVGEGGVVYETDLGEETFLRARELSTFDPGEGWTAVD